MTCCAGVLQHMDNLDRERAFFEGPHPLLLSALNTDDITILLSGSDPKTSQVCLSRAFDVSLTDGLPPLTFDCSQQPGLSEAASAELLEACFLAEADSLNILTAVQPHDTW